MKSELPETEIELKADGELEIKNQLLKRLPAEELDEIAKLLSLKKFQIKDPVYEPGKPIEFVYFPQFGVESLVAYVHDDEVIEVATIGNEGFVGVPVMLGARSITGLCFCQIAGEALIMRAEDFKDCLSKFPRFQEIMNKYAETLFNQIAQNAACNRSHNLEERCARWLLFCHDRMDRKSFFLTQEFLGQMLGVRRPAVNVAASTLQKAGYISYVRGVISVTDREGLESASCVCYSIVQNSYKKVFGDK